MPDLPLKVENNAFDINYVVKELYDNGVKNLEGTSISYFDPELRNYVFCGVFPNLRNIKIPIKLLEQNDFFKNSIKYEIGLRARYFPKEDQNIPKMKMHFIQDDHEHNEENNNCNLKVRSRRSKERKLGYIIEKVYLWRKLVKGFNHEHDKKMIRLTQIEAAKEVGISKKSLDDYLKQIK